MEKTSSHSRASSFWFDFALGATLGAAATYLLTTKKGKEILKQLLEFSENIGENLGDIIDNMQEGFTEDGIDVPTKRVAPQLNNVIEKIRSISKNK